MANNGLIAGILVLTVSIILVGTVLVSALDVADDEFNPVYTNTSNGNRMSIVESATISKTADTGINATINDKEIPINSAANALVLTDSFVINARTANFYVITASTATNVNAATAFTATIGNGSITYQIGTSDPVTITYSGDLLVADPDGDYVNVSSGSAYADKVDSVYAWTWGADSKLYVSKGEACTVAGVAGSTAALNGAEDSTYSGLYTFSVSGVKLDPEGTNYSPVTVIVPTSVEATLSVGSNVSPILAVIPVMVIVAIVVLAVTIFVRRGE